MATTVTNTNPITITGGTMAAGARATIYPNQIKRGFKVTAVGILAGNTSSTLVIGDNSSAANTLFQLGGVPNAGYNHFTLPTPAEWADWAVTTLANTTDKVFVYIK